MSAARAEVDRSRSKRLGEWVHDTTVWPPSYAWTWARTIPTAGRFLSVSKTIVPPAGARAGIVFPGFSMPGRAPEALNVSSAVAVGAGSVDAHG